MWFKGMHLPSMYETLTLIPSTTKTTKICSLEEQIGEQRTNQPNL